MAVMYNKDLVHDAIQNSPPWYRNPNLVKLYLLLLSPLLTSTAWGFDLSMTNSLQSVDKFMTNFGNPTGATLGFFGASSSVGGIVACIIGGPLNERFGRRMLCFVGGIIVIAMGIMQTFSTSFGMFSGGKLLLGLGSNLQQVAGPVLVTELAHPKQRVAMTSIYNTSIYIGLIIGAWITFGTFGMASDWSWKIPCILQIMLPIYQVLTIWFCPESPRWLVSKGRIEEARKILVKYHGNGVEDAVVQAELHEIIAGVEADKTKLKFEWDGIKTILGSKGNRHRLWLCFWTAVGSQCAGSNFISTYLPEILDQIGMTTSKEKTLINGISSIWCWVCALLAALLIPRVTRRQVFLFSMTGMTSCFIIWTALSATYLRTGEKNFGIGVLVMIFIFNFFNSICWIPLVITYPLETVTTKQRSLFFAFTMLTINASSFVASFINPIGIQNLSWRYYIVQCVFNALLTAIIYFTFAETHGLTLEEIAVIFDGEERFRDAIATIELDKAGFEDAHKEEVVERKV